MNHLETRRSENAPTQPKRGTYIVPQQQRRPVTPRVPTSSGPTVQYANAVQIARTKTRSDWECYSFYRQHVLEKLTVEPPHLPAHLVRTSKGETYATGTLPMSATATFTDPRPLRDLKSKLSSFTKNLRDPL